MSTNTKIFQIYYKPELAEHLDPAFAPLDNTANPCPELREWHVWDKHHESVLVEGLDHWGFVSWKFKEKINLTGQQALNFINDNPGYDVYLFNPCIVNEAVFANGWEQGDLHHPNISEIGNEFLKKLGYTDVNVSNMLLDRNTTVFATYIVGNRNFWTKFMSFSRRIFTEADKDPVFHQRVFGTGLSNYAYDKSAPNFAFLIERLVSTFIELEEIKAIGFKHTEETLPEKYQPFVNDIMALSDLKVAINQYNSDELYDIWDYYRRKFLQENTNILGLE